MLRLRRLLEPRHRHPDRAHRALVAAAPAGSTGLNVTVRVAGAGDIYALASLRRSWTADLDGHGSPADPRFEDAFADWWVSERERRTTWLAECGEAAVGMVNLLEYRRMPRPNRAPTAWGYVGNAYVRAAHRGRGVGTRLLQAVVAEARRRGYERLVVNPSQRSVPLWSRAGFTPDSGLFVLEHLREDL